ncbi:hypothetical protein [Leptolyngbya sp. NIES-2104]|uniref:hypothetical protein n=1 Tax=Leptolyngbya sp. NIES-2104 TaxID=1552121 RepID=UPI0006ECBD86|nr:hypothetical protein [Leptolyngbya sp. NIES-2104]GAP94836.1 hypothetical protein NIES2104_13530 [Leptolyngbya sp. NIES-2104]
MSTLLPIGSIPGLPEARVILANQGFVPLPMLETRSTTVHTFLSIDPPENADEEFWKAVGECLVLASAGAIVAGTMSGGIAALPTFMQVFGAKATTRGLELVANQLKIVTQTTYSDWG